MRVLITNAALDERSGTSLYCSEVARELLRLGHEPALYSLRLGQVASELCQAGVPVTDRLRRLPWVPDIIHGNSRGETQAALARFPETPAIFVCHDQVHWFARLPRHPRLSRTFGVSELCLRRMLREGADPERATLSLNFVDLRRFAPRSALPERPARALIFSNYASDATHLPAVREACRRAGLALDVVGLAVGRPTASPERLLADYDIVFAKARAAMEAMAVGTAVVLCDFGGVGPMVTAKDFGRLRPLNFGFEALTDPLTPESLLRQITRYDANDASAVRDLVRAQCGLERAVATLVEVYEQAIGERRAISRPGRERSDLSLPEFRLALGDRLNAAWSALPHRHALSRVPGFDALKRGLTRLVLGNTWDYRRRELVPEDEGEGERP